MLRFHPGHSRIIKCRRDRARDRIGGYDFDLLEMQNPTNQSPQGETPATAEDRNDLKRRLAFLDLGTADAERLRSLRGLGGQYIGEFVQSFYRHLFSFEETARFLRD